MASSWAMGFLKRSLDKEPVVVLATFLAVTSTAAVFIKTPSAFKDHRPVIKEGAPIFSKTGPGEVSVVLKSSMSLFFCRWCCWAVRHRDNDGVRENGAFPTKTTFLTPFLLACRTRIPLAYPREFA